MKNRTFLFIFILFFIQNISATVYPDLKGAKYANLMPRELDINIKLDGQTDFIKYIDISKYNETNFKIINNDRITFRAEEILGFLSIFKKRKDYPQQFNIDFIAKDNSFTMKCDIKVFSKEEPISIYRSRKKYNFDWFLDPLKLNFNQFKMVSKNKLYWAGKIDNVPVTINIDFGFPIEYNKKEVWKKNEKV